MKRTNKPLFTTALGCALFYSTFYGAARLRSIGPRYLSRGKTGVSGLKSGTRYAVTYCQMLIKKPLEK